MRRKPWWWPSSHGWVALGAFSLSVFIIILMFADPEFRKDEFIKTIGSLVVGTALVNGVIAYYYGGSSDSGAEKTGKDSDNDRSTDSR